MNIFRFENHSRAHLTGTLSKRKALILLSLAVLLVGPAFISMPKAQAAVTINQGLGAGSATASAFGNQRTVYYVQYVASPLSYRWWAFYSTPTGIDYQSSTNGNTWSAQATLTSSGDYSYGGAFSAYLSGSNLYYAVASASGNTLFFGEVNLALSGAANPVPGTSGSLTTTNAMTGTSATSILVDSNGYTWVSVATAGTLEVWACKGTLGSCTWLAQGSASGLSTFALNNGSPSSELLNLGSSVALLFVNPGTASTYGVFDTYYLTSSGTSYVAWNGPYSPSSVFYQQNYFSAVTSGSTIYVTGDMAGFVNAFSYTLGAGAVSAETAVISTAPGTYEPTLSLSQGTLAMAYPSGSSVAYYTAPLPGTTWTLAGSLTPPRYLAQNTENTPQYVTSTSGDNGSSKPSVGYLWTNSGGQMRFSTMDIIPIPVSVTLSLTEYVFHYASAVETGKVSPTNSYTISYWACVPSCSSATLTTAQYTSSIGAPLTLTNVASQTQVSISGTTSGSTATEEWCLNQSCTPTVFGASDGITTSWYYFDLLAETSKYTVVGGPAPSAPTIIYEGAPGSSGNSATPAGYSATMSATSVTYWMLRNYSSSATAAIAGLPSEQWAAGGSGDTVAWTSTAANIITPNIVYYHQYQNTYTITQAGTVTTFPLNTGFSLAGTLYGVAWPFPFTGTGVAGPITQLLWTDAGATVTFPKTATSGVPAGTQWIDSTGAAFTTGVINTGGNPTVTQSYYEQYSQTLQYNTKDGSIMPTVPQLTYTAFGVVTPYTITGSPIAIWIDAGTTATIPGHVYGGSGERWVTTKFSWTITSSGLIPDPIVYYHQFQQQVFYATNDGVAMSTIPVFTYTNNGTVYTGGTGYTLTLVAHLLYVDAATTASVPTPICSGACASATQQWVTAPSSWSITGYEVVDSGSSGKITYSHQFQITLAVSPAGTGTTSPVAGTAVWETTLTPFSIIGSFNVNYAFSSWTTSSPSITVASAAAASTTASIAAAGTAGTITANFVLQSGLQFIETGLNLNGPSWQVIITSYTGSGTFTCPTGPSLPCTVSSTTSGIFLSGIPVGTYGYTVPTPQPWSPGVQYIATFVTNGNPGSIGVNPSSSVSITFQAQFYLTTAQIPINSGTIALTPLGGWYASGTTVTLVATATAPGALFSSWTLASGCAPNCNQGAGTLTSTITTVMPANPETATANFNVPMSISLNTPIVTSGLGSTVQVTVTVTGGTGTVTMSNSALGSGIAVTFSPTTFPASASGATSIMIVTISPSAPLPVYTFNVIGTDSRTPTADTVQTLFTLYIVAPTASQVGYSGNPYAITYASQTAVFSAAGDWFTFYSGSQGTNLVYSASSSNPANPWTLRNVIQSPPYPSAIPGYAFAVANSGNNVYLAVISAAHPGSFYYGFGTISGQIITFSCTGACVNVGGTMMEQLPISNLELATCVSCILYSAGSPSIMVDTLAVPTTIWVTIPAVYSNAGLFSWHVEITTLTGPLAVNTPLFGSPQDVHLAGLNASSVTSAVHTQLYSMQDGVAATFAVGNTPDIPRVVMFSHAGAYLGTYCPNAACAANSIMGVGWGNLYFYEQQSQAGIVTGTDNLFFAGLARTTSVVGATADMFSFTYNPVTKIGNFSSPSALAINPITSYAALVSHSWHIAILYGAPNLYISYGVDNHLSFMIGTANSVHTAGDAPTASWSASTPVTGAANVVGGVTMASSGTTVGLVWVEFIPGAPYPRDYQVQFAVV